MGKRCISALNSLKGKSESYRHVWELDFSLRVTKIHEMKYEKPAFPNTLAKYPSPICAGE